MSEYRIVVRHVRYWRGKVHRWSNVYPFTGSVSTGDIPTAVTALYNLEMRVCYPSPAGHGGGVWEIAVYNSATGGVPISVTNYFDPDSPSAWIAYNGIYWPDTSHTLETVAEVALQVQWLAGLSRSGKPVRFRKWSHSVPSSGAAPGAPDLSPTTITDLEDGYQAQLAIVGGTGLLLGRNGRLAATRPVVLNVYGNHQMPRGRKRLVKAAARAASSFPPGLLVVPGSDGSLSE